jgi:integrase
LVDVPLAEEGQSIAQSQIGAGVVALTKLAPQQVQALYSAKRAGGLSPTTVRHLHALLHHALDQALRWDLVARNVTDLVDAPSMSRKDVEALTPDQARALLAEARGDRLEALYVVAVHTGMRQGELLALRWRDVALDVGLLHVRSNLERAEVGVRMGTPKTARSRRTIKLSATSVEALREHRSRQDEERLARADAWTDHDLVFPNTVGKPMDGIHLLRREFVPLLERAGLPRVRFHDLRHTAATLMRRAGANVEVVSEMLGHADPTTTIRIYSHVQPGMQQSAVDALDELLRD